MSLQVEDWVCRGMANVCCGMQPSARSMPWHGQIPKNCWSIQSGQTLKNHYFIMVTDF